MPNQEEIGLSPRCSMRKSRRCWSSGGRESKLVETSVDGNSGETPEKRQKLGEDSRVEGSSTVCPLTLSWRTNKAMPVSPIVETGKNRKDLLVQVPAKTAID